MNHFSWLGNLGNGEEKNDLLVYLNLLLALQVECDIAMMHILEGIDGEDTNAVKIAFLNMRQQNNFNRVYVGEILDDAKFRIRTSSEGEIVP